MVLPLVDMSVDQSEAALCDGLTEELSNWLAHIPTLRVVARTSAFAFKGQNIDVRKIAGELGASHVLEGSLRRSGDQLRITVQLIAADTGLHMWSRSFDRPIGDIFQIEDTVSRAVAEQLHLELTAETAELWAQRQPGTMEAHELYLLGRARQSRRTAEDNLKSVEYFRRAVQADPQYVPALVGLAESLLNGISLNRAPIEDVKAEAEPLINRAMQINPDLPEVLAVKGWLLNEEYRSEEALPLLLRATKLNPNDASSHRFLGDLYDRLAQTRGGDDPFRAAARWTHGFHLARVPLHGTRGSRRIHRARRLHARAELDPTHMWGPLATSWIARAQGKTRGDAVDRRRAQAAAAGRLPRRSEDRSAAGEGKIRRSARGDARAAARPEVSSRWLANRTSSMRRAGAAAKTGWPNTTRKARAGTGAELIELARMQLSGDPVTARATVAQPNACCRAPARTCSMVARSAMNIPWRCCWPASSSRAAATKARAMKMHGPRRHAGSLRKEWRQALRVVPLRAESLVMQGKTAEAQAALNTAWKKGWRSVWRARRESYFAGIEFPE